MRNFKNSVSLKFWRLDDALNLVIDIKLMQRIGKRLIAPVTYSLEGDDSSIIRFLYGEVDDETITESSQILNNFMVEIAQLPENTSSDLSKLSGWVEATQNSDHKVVPEYKVIVEVEGDNERRIVSYISDDADIDQVRTTQS